MAIWEDLLSILSSGKIPGIPSEITFFGLPSLAFLSIPLIAGLVLGFLVKKALKIALIGIIAVGAGLYFGVLSMDTLKTALEIGKSYGPEAMQYAAILFGMLPLGIGFIIGLIIGLKFG